jgi:hypothetical protein
VNNKGDGMAFFLGQRQSDIPPRSTGGSLGLCTDPCSGNAVGEDRFVAVEFDTFNNSWDPNRTYDHMGIDVNSIKSVANITLPSFSLNGTMSARVDYNGSTGVMDVQLLFGHNPMFRGATPTYNLSAKVDLSTALPAQVAMGFSAATGASGELHQLLSWSFSLLPSAGSGISAPSTATGTAPGAGTCILLLVPHYRQRIVCGDSP